MFSIQCAACDSTFEICRACYTGHKYCSPECRNIGYRRSLNRARKKHELSPEARLDHRDRSRAFRLRHRQPGNDNRNSVTDETSDENLVQLNFAGEKNVCVVCGCKFLGSRVEILNEDLELQFFDTD